MAVVILLSDFVDGTSMALAEDTDAPDLKAFMTANQGRLWAHIKQRRRQKQLTGVRRGPGTVYFALDEEAASTVETYLRCNTRSPEERLALEAMQKAGVEIAPHVGSDRERNTLLDGQLRGLTPQARTQGFGE